MEWSKNEDQDREKWEKLTWPQKVAQVLKIPEEELKRMQSQRSENEVSPSDQENPKSEQD